MPHDVEHQQRADKIHSNEKRLRQQPRVLSSSDRRVIEAWPNRIEQEVAGVACGKNAEKTDNA